MIAGERKPTTEPSAPPGTLHSSRRSPRWRGLRRAKVKNPVCLSGDFLGAPGERERTVLRSDGTDHHGEACGAARLRSADGTAGNEGFRVPQSDKLGTEEKREYEISHTPFPFWNSLPDYKPAPVLEPDPEPEDEPVQDDPAQNAKQTVQITKDPVFVRAGRKSKRYPVECGIASCEFEVKGKLDAECSAVVKDGVLRVILEGKWDGKTLGTSALQQKGIEEKPRHGCRISPNEPRGKQTKGERRTKAKTFRNSIPALLNYASCSTPSS